jgi:hypothetical protein
MDESIEPYVTKTGREMSDAEIEGLAAEAERGYPVWRCTLRFELRHGELNREADSHLTKRGIRRVVPLSDGGYIYECTVPGVDFVGGLAHAKLNLSAILNPYDVLHEVVDAKAVKLP